MGQLEEPGENETQTAEGSMPVHTSLAVRLVYCQDIVTNIPSPAPPSPPLHPSNPRLSPDKSSIMDLRPPAMAGRDPALSPVANLPGDLPLSMPLSHYGVNLLLALVLCSEMGQGENAL
ncbi:unnamed protein product [Gadus morhua 'NCC']